MQWCVGKRLTVDSANKMVLTWQEPIICQFLWCEHSHGGPFQPIT